MGPDGEHLNGTCLRTSPFVLSLPDTLLVTPRNWEANKCTSDPVILHLAKCTGSTSGCIPRPSRLASFSDGTHGTRLSMIIFKIGYHDLDYLFLDTTHAHVLTADQKTASVLQGQLLVRSQKIGHWPHLYVIL